MIRFTDEERERIVQGRKNGMSFARLGSLYGYDRRTIRKFISDDDYSIGCNLPTEDDYKTVARLKLMRVTALTIAKEIGRTQESVEHMVKELKRRGELPNRRLMPTKPEAPNNPEDDFSFAVYQYIAMHTGCTDDEIAEATGYSLSRVAAETKRLGTGEGRLIERHGRGWQKYVDRVSDYAMAAASSRELKRINEAA